MIATPEPRERAAIDRPLGWLIAIGGCILILDQTVPSLVTAGDFAPWWNLGSAVVAAVFVVLAATGMFLPMHVLDLTWRTLPIAYFCLQATWLLGLAEADPESVVPWLWTMEPAAICLLMLVTRPAIAVAVGFSASLLPALSGLILLGHVPRAVFLSTPSQLSNALYLVVLVALRARLRRLHASERAVHVQRSRQVRAAARLEQQVALQRIVHDEVLSVLTSAMLTSGAPSPELRQEARRATAALNASRYLAPGSVVTLDMTDAVAQLASDLRRVDPDVGLDVRGQGGQLPAAVAAGVGLAAAEALRNSLRHGGPDATRTVQIETGINGIEVRVHDDGVGFDPDGGGQRLGIATSIVGRMADLGGTARIESTPGVGTEVVLTWTS